MVVLASCITSTFMVTRRNSSAWACICTPRAWSAWKIFSSVRPWMLSRKPSPMEVYLPQYLAKIRLAYRDTATMDSGIRGTQHSRARAVGQSSQTHRQNRITGASMA